MAVDTKTKAEAEEAVETAVAEEAPKATVQATEATASAEEDAPIKEKKNVTYKARPGQRIKLPKCEVAKEGYHFVYYATNPDGSGRTFRPGELVKPSEAKDLYPIYRRDRCR